MWEEKTATEEKWVKEEWTKEEWAEKHKLSPLS
jgi:hypothetical protein